MTRALACVAVAIIVTGCDAPERTAPVSSAPSASAAMDPDAARVAQSRALMGRFAQALQGELMQAMSSGGPTRAIAVCSERAPRIADELELGEGWSIGRTSDKLRNPQNAPDAWEREVLAEFTRRKAAGASIESLEKHAFVERGGRKVFRHMKAIGIQPLCLGCHGEQLAPDVAAELSRRYPDDHATGYAAGDLRGAFSVEQEL